jgi:hypothetical protein
LYRLQFIIVKENPSRLRIRLYYSPLEGNPLKTVTTFSAKPRLAAALLGAALIAAVAGFYFRPVHAQDNLTPGMLFGPLWVDNGQHLELCASYLSPGSITAVVHFRNLTTGEVTTGEQVTIPSGGGGCVTYAGKGHVVGMARGEGSASDWVSPSNALISTMSIVDDQNSNTLATVLGVAKLWVRGL